MTPWYNPFYFGGIKMDENYDAFDDYAMTFDLNEDMIAYKYNHSYRVVHQAEEICRSINTDTEERDLASLIALLHDVARFRQWTEYRTFKDNKSFDHGDEGVKILFEEGLIKNFIVDKKDYDVLNERYKQLQMDFSNLTDSKNALEREKDKRNEEYNKIIGELQCDNENLQIGFNDKLTKNKNCFSQNSILQKQIELKDNEICNLTNKLNELENQFCRNEDDRANLQKLLNGLNDIKNSQNYKIEQLIEDNKTLKQICEDQENDIRLSNEDKKNLSQELDDKNNDIINLNSQIRGEINDINNLQNQLNKNNGLSLQYESNIKDYQRQLDFLKRDNDNLKNNIYKEKGINSEESQKNKELSNILEDREQTINQLTQDIENIKIMQQNEENKNNLLQDENTKLRNHIMTLTEQNQNLINEIDCVIEEDEKAKYILDRKKRISSVLLTNRNTIDQSLNNLDECINKGNINYENSNTPISRSKFSYEFQ